MSDEHFQRGHQLPSGNIRICSIGAEGYQMSLEEMDSGPKETASSQILLLA